MKKDLSLSASAQEEELLDVDEALTKMLKEKGELIIFDHI